MSFQQSQQQQPSQSLQQSQAAPAYFQALLDRGQKRANTNDEPQLQLGLQDIARKVRNLGNGFTDARAHYLLSASGVNTSEALRDLEELAGPRSTIPPPNEPVAAGVKETLAREHESDFQQMVDSHIKRAHAEFDQMIEERLHGVDWDAHRQRIYEHFGLKRPQTQDGANVIGGASANPGTSTFGRSSRRGRISTASRSTYGIPGMSKSVIGSVGPRDLKTSVFNDVADRLPADGFRPAPNDSMLRKKQDKFADRVKDLNIARLQEKVYPLLTRFAEVEAEPSHDDTSMLVNAFKALVHITGEDATKENVSEPGVVRARQYAKGYLDDAGGAENVLVRKRIIDGSRTFLEKLFYSQVRTTVARNPTEAHTGGTPSALNVVKGYVRVRAVRKELGSDMDALQQIGDDYCWAVMFYLLRSGLFDEASVYLAENRDAFRSIDSHFVKYLEHFTASPDHRLPPTTQTSISNAYSMLSRLAPQGAIDPYKLMCYKVLGRCELGRRTLENITNDMMDWLWLQFALAREFSRVDEMAHEAYGLDNVQESIEEVGNRYFQPGTEIANAAATFFFMQILAGKFEKAVADLYPHNYVSAVHFAIGLDFYGLLRVSDISNSDDLLTLTTRAQHQIAFGSMIGLYTRDFRTANVTAAVDYITLICLNADLQPKNLGKAQRELCHQALTEVVLETREFSQLIGDIRADGMRIKGAIELRLKLIGLGNEREYLRQITLVAARIAEEQGRTTDAALLYHMCDDYDKVYQVINEAVSLALITELGEQPARLQPLKPRNTDDHNNQEPNQEQASLSLTQNEDPIQLAKDIMQLYKSDGMYLNKISRKYSDACEVLLQLAAARKELENGRWSQVVDSVTASDVIPTEAAGNISAIRSKSQAFDLMPTTVARTIGHVMVWTVIALSNQVTRLKNQEYETPAINEAISRCVQSAKDVMVFAGLIRYKLPGRVWETLARAGQDLGAY
ncbi:hypothetical protein DOTSEDRAFT_177217 [Dothistroma septosporum NZE10]|uniref:Nuclear pore protein n=1 Tax=Dothistroma septosporum (strain NZE10 / CBS 128990) TaxID=675120 RepID=N1PGU7_DOTSN|nr:hypothetical protein DOTSEDRAFT_177217 [Dothistroma septosporum NZE10]